MDEELILNDTKKLEMMNYYLTKYQFSIDFLIKTIDYYDSWICLKFQLNLTPEFCFKYLYNKKTDSVDNWITYQDIEIYFLKKGLTSVQISQVFYKIY